MNIERKRPEPRRCMTYLTACVTLLFLPANQLLAQEPAIGDVCTSYVAYRDNELVSAWDREAKRFDAAQDSLEVIKAAKKDVAANASLADPVAAAEMMVRTVKLAANLISDILNINPSLNASYGRAIEVTERVLSSATLQSKVLDAYYKRKDVGALSKLLVDEAVEQAGKAIGGPGAATLVATYRLQDNARELAEAHKMNSELRESLLGALSRSEAELRRADVKLKAARDALNAIQAVKTTIDSVCGRAASTAASPVRSTYDFSDQRGTTPFGIDPDRSSRTAADASRPSPRVSARSSDAGADAGGGDSPSALDMLIRSMNELGRVRGSAPSSVPVAPVRSAPQPAPRRSGCNTDTPGHPGCTP